MGELQETRTTATAPMNGVYFLRDWHYPILMCIQDMNQQQQP